MELCPVVGFGISSVGPLSSSTVTHIYTGLITDEEETLQLKLLTQGCE